MTEVVGGDLPIGNQTWALGEGWSEFFGTSITDDPIAGEYVCGDARRLSRFFLRQQPAGLLGPVHARRRQDANRTRRRDLDRRALGSARRARQGRDRAAGHRRHQEHAPRTATFLDARDGILAADMATNGGANQCLIWRVFAGREMGVSARRSPTRNRQLTPSLPPRMFRPLAFRPRTPAVPYTTPEGTDKMLNGAASTPGTDPSAGTIAQYRWDLDNDGEFDDATGATPLFTAVGQDGTFTIRLRVTNAAGVSDTATTTITVTNVVPVVGLQSIAATVEGASVSLIGTASDPGWLDPLTATVDWDDGNGPQALTGAIEHVRPNATLTFSRATRVRRQRRVHHHGVRLRRRRHVVRCRHRDSGQRPADRGARASGQTSYGGQSAYVIEAGGSVSVTAMSVDPGSDDLTLTWDWDHGRGHRRHLTRQSTRRRPGEESVGPAAEPDADAQPHVRRRLSLRLHVQRAR